MTEHAEGTSEVQRRTIIKGAAWTVPVLAVSAVAPNAAASLGGVIAFDKPLYQVGPNGVIAALPGRVTTTSGVMPSTVTLSYPAGFTGPATASVDASGAFTVVAVTAPGAPTSGMLTASAPGLTSGITSLQVLSNVVPVPSDGIVWGENLNNTLFRSGGGNLAFAATPDYIAAGTALGAAQIVAMAGGYRGANSYLLRSDGALWSHGDGGNATAPGTTGGDAGQFAFSGLLAQEALVDVAAFTGGGYALTTAGRVYAWGFNTSAGSLGNGTSGPDTNAPKLVKLPEGVFIRQISASYTGGLALDGEGQIWAWGINDQNDTGTGLSGSVLTPSRVVFKDGSPVVGAEEVRGRFKGGLARVGGRVLSWGTNSGGQLGNGGVGVSRGYADWVLASAGTPLAGVAKLATGYHEAYHSVALGADGTLYTWGYGSYNVHSPSSEAERSYAAPYGGTLPAGGVRDVAVSYYGTHILLDDQTVWNWGYGSYGQGASGASPAINAAPVQAMMDASTPVTASGFFPASHGGVIARK